MKKIWKGFMRDLWIVLLDILAVNAAYFVALLLRFYVNNELRTIAKDFYLPVFLNFAPFYTVLSVAVFALFRLYGGMWQFAGINDMNRIIKANLVTAVIHILGTMFVFPPEGRGRMPFTYYAIGAGLQFLFISMIRFGYRILLAEKRKVIGRKVFPLPAIVFGAGETARKAIVHMEDTPFRAVAAVDEKNAGKMLNGVPVVGDYKEFLSYVRGAFIADRNLNPEKRNEIQEKCRERGIEVHDYTGPLSNIGGQVPVSSLLELVKGPVTIVADGQEKEYSDGENALKELKERYEIDAIEGAKIILRKPSFAAFIGYDTWVQQHKEDTGEDVSFF